MRPCGLPWRKRATPSKAAATAKSFCPSTGSMARPCSPCWMRSSPASSTMDRPGSLSPPGTPSASVPCTMATTKRASSSLPASPRTWWAFAARSCPSRRAATIKAARSIATGTSRQWNRSAGMTWTPPAGRSTTSWWPGWRNGWWRTPRWAFCSPAGWIPPWCAPLPPGRAKRPSAPLPSACGRTPST